MKRDKALLYTVSGLLIAFLFYYCFFRMVPFTHLWEGLKSFPRGLLILAFGVYLWIPVMRGLRLQLLTEAHGRALRLGEAVKISFLGFFFGSFATLLGADGAKTLALRQSMGEGASAAAVVAADRIAGILSLMIYISMVLVLWSPALNKFGLHPDQIFFPLVMMALGTALLPGVFMLLWWHLKARTPRALSKAEHPLLFRLHTFLSDLLVFRGRGLVLAKVMALSFFELVAYLLYCMILLWDTPVTLPEVGIISVIELFIFAVPFLTQGLGIMEATMAFLLLALGLEPGRAASVPLVLRAFTLFSVSVGGCLFWRWGKGLYRSLNRTKE